MLGSNDFHNALLSWIWLKRIQNIYLSLEPKEVKKLMIWISNRSHHYRTNFNMRTSKKNEMICCMDELKHEIIGEILTLGNRGRPDFHLFWIYLWKTWNYPELSDLQNKLIATNCTGKVSSNSIVLLTSPQYIPTLQSIIEKMDESLSRRNSNLINLSFLLLLLYF